MAELLDLLGLSRPADDSAVCFEVYSSSIGHDAAAEDLDALGVACMQQLLPLMRGYVWQHEPLQLRNSISTPPPWLLKKHKSKAPQQQQQPPCLWGTLRYEDNVEDEWFVVWLLMRLTGALPGLSARLWDDDGEFLLIEAAYSLPRWLKPESSANRVWLHAGQLHVVPPPSRRAPTLPPHPTAAQALAILGSCVDTHQPRIEAVIAARVSGYPARAVQQLQRTLAWLPARVAALLQRDPQLVAAAVGAFMSRQRQEVQASARMAVFPPHDMTTALVCLNRCMYAQLLQSEFGAPPRYPSVSSRAAAGSAWLGGVAARQAKAHAMGVKLTAGFEILALRLGLQPGPDDAAAAAAAAVARQGNGGAAGSNGSTLQQQQQPLHEQQQPLHEQQQQPLHEQQQQPSLQQHQQQQSLQQLAGNPAWRAYVAGLQRAGFFGDELQGSARHRQLLAAATDAFVGSEAYAASCEAAAAPAQHLRQLLAAIDAQQQQQQVEQLSPAAAVFPADSMEEDGDAWMAEEAEQLTRQLEEQEALAAAHAAKRKHKPQQQQQQQQQQQEAAVDAEELLSGLKQFVQHLSGPEGAEVPAAAPPGCGASGVASSSRTQGLASAAAAGGVGFSTDAFVRELLGVLGPPDALASGASQQQQQAAGAAGQDARGSELADKLQVLQQQLQGLLGGSAGGSDSDDGDDDSTGVSSSDEGSSFYGDDEADDSGSSDDIGGADSSAGPTQLPVPPPVSAAAAARSQQQSQRQPQQQPAQWQLPPSFRPVRTQDAWEVRTATDSDDDDDEEDDGLSLGGSDDGSDDGSDGGSGSGGRGAAGSGAGAAAGFYEAYASALDEELAASTLVQSFERAGAAAGASGEPAGAVPGGAGGGGPGGGLAGLAPLDMDVNLIKSLVASYSAQGGLPGPASNLAGLLGLQLPTQVVEEQ